MLYPNQFVNVRLLLDTHKDVTTMSTAGVQRGVPGTFVYLINATTPCRFAQVQLGVTDGDRVEVRSGLAPGDRIVIDGADKLRDGAKINVRTENGRRQRRRRAQINRAAKKRSDSGQKQ